MDNFDGDIDVDMMYKLRQLPLCPPLKYDPIMLCNAIMGVTMVTPRCKYRRPATFTPISLNLTLTLTRQPRLALYMVTASTASIRDSGHHIYTVNMSTHRLCLGLAYTRLHGDRGRRV